MNLHHAEVFALFAISSSGDVITLKKLWGLFVSLAVCICIAFAIVIIQSCLQKYVDLSKWKKKFGSLIDKFADKWDEEVKKEDETSQLTSDRTSATSTGTIKR